MLTRRSLLLSSAATVIASLSEVSRLRGAPTNIRYNAASPEGKAMLRIYAAGVRAMKALNDQDPNSWKFQWYIHATPKDKADVINDVFGGVASPARALADKTWYTCQSHLSQPEDYFLPWHRLYVLQFEEIIREITKHPEFTLPYWDYTSPASYSLPDEFQLKNSADPRLASLFVKGRNVENGKLSPPQAANVNAGDPLNKNFQARRNFLVLPDPAPREYSDFCRQLDQNLHGSIHVYTGDQTNMGSIPTAAGDPVFWLHHCNIDRIWAGWNETGGKTPQQTNGKLWADTKFVFADGQEVAIDTVAENAKLTYAYDILPTIKLPPIVVAEMSTTTNTLLKSVMPEATITSAAPTTSSPLTLGAEPQTIMLAPVNSESRLQAIAPQFAAEGPTRLMLLLKGLQAKTDPNTVYQLFLDLPPNASQDVADQHYVGLVNFFGVAIPAGHEAHGGRSVEFDVTEVVARLLKANGLKSETTVTLVPLGPPAEGSAPVLSEGIELQRR